MRHLRFQFELSATLALATDIVTMCSADPKLSRNRGVGLLALSFASLMRPLFLMLSATHYELQYTMTGAIPPYVASKWTYSSESINAIHDLQVATQSLATFDEELGSHTFALAAFGTNQAFSQFLTSQEHITNALHSMHLKVFLGFSMMVTHFSTFFIEKQTFSTFFLALDEVGQPGWIP